MYCIVGQTGAGKDTIANLLSKRTGWKILCSYTTRPQRATERDGVEHYFISDEKMKEILKGDEVVAYTKIEDPKTGSKGYEYCTTRSGIKESQIYIIDPNGVKYLREKMPEQDICILYVDVPYTTRKQRVLEGGRGTPDEVLAAFEKREANEREQFREFAKAKTYDYRIENISLSQAIEDVITVVNSMEKRNGFRFLSRQDFQGYGTYDIGFDGDEVELCAEDFEDLLDLWEVFCRENKMDSLSIEYIYKVSPDFI